MTTSRKHNPHTSHLKGRSPVWGPLCDFKDPLWNNLNPHTSHLNGRLPVWVHICDFKDPLLKNINPHKAHLKGFSPVWIRRWVFKQLLLRAKHNPYMKHLKGLSPVWVRMWPHQSELHKWHSYGVSCEWMVTSYRDWLCSLIHHRHSWHFCNKRVKHHFNTIWLERSKIMRQLKWFQQKGK